MTRLERAANLWMDDNPDMMELFRLFAEEKLRRRQRFGISALTERVRWECQTSWKKGDYKINNNHRAYIARRLIEEIPELGEYLETRRAKHEANADMVQAL